MIYLICNTVKKQALIKFGNTSLEGIWFEKIV
jgi:hypothetical protein